jgi:hypothetical protein
MLFKEVIAVYWENHTKYTVYEECAVNVSNGTKDRGYISSIIDSFRRLFLVCQRFIQSSVFIHTTGAIRPMTRCFICGNVVLPVLQAYVYTGDPIRSPAATRQR